MPQYPVELSNVIYNPATQSFEALARVHDPEGSRSYACAIAAPITTEFPRASEGLATQALRRHGRIGLPARLPRAQLSRGPLSRLSERALNRLRSVRKAA